MQHTVVSWDIGINNLAYCIIKFIGDEFNIIKWDIINLADDRMKCEHQLKGGAGTCGKIAKHIFCIKETDDDKKYYCKTHINKADYKLIIPLDNIKCDKCKQSAVKIVDGTSMGWCEKHCVVEAGKYKRRCARKIDQSCAKQSKGKLAESMYNKLDEIPHMMEVDEVLLENQPVLKNPTMKSIGDLLFGYFIMRGVCDNKGLFGVVNVRHISASGKLKVNKNNSDKQLKKGKNDKDVYNITKGLGIKYTTALINNVDLKHLNTYKKKDDLCDAFLQAIRVHYGDTLPATMIMKLKQVSDTDITCADTTSDIKTKSKKSAKKSVKSKVTPQHTDINCADTTSDIKTKSKNSAKKSVKSKVASQHTDITCADTTSDIKTNSKKSTKKSVKSKVASQHTDITCADTTSDIKTKSKKSTKKSVKSKVTPVSS